MFNFNIMIVILILVYFIKFKFNKHEFIILINTNQFRFYLTQQLIATYLNGLHPTMFLSKNSYLSFGIFIDQ